MLTGRDIVLISSIEWDFLWQHAQEIASRLAHAGNRVLYIENTGIRTPRLKDARRVGHRLKFWTRSLFSHGVREVQQNLFVCSPLVLPPFGRGRHEINRRLLLPLLRYTSTRLGMRDPLIWTHLPTDTALDLIRLLRTPRSVVVYYCIADFAQLTPHASELQRSEKAVVETSDLVFSNSQQLAQHCERWTKKVHIFPPGLNLSEFPLELEKGHRHFAGPGEGEGKVPVIGYVGGIHRHMAIDMLSAMARRRPNWRWVLVGPLQTSLGDLAKAPNVSITGQKPHSELARYIRSFDVCIVPYVNNAETATVVPIKINEYLAAGKPVVSTDLPAVCEFNRRHNILTTATARADDFLHAIEQALHSTNGDSILQRRRTVAALSDWHDRIEAMSELIEAELKQKSCRLDARG